MRRSPALAIVLEAIGVALLVGGVTAWNSAPPETSDAIAGGPGSKAIALMGIGAVVAGFGLVWLLRPRQA